MKNHFLFQPGEWLGAGEVSFSMSPDVLQFRTKWVITAPEAEDFYFCTQTVEVIGGDRIINAFEITRESEEAFEIILENELLGTFIGSGIVEEGLVAWEFREKGTFEGYEVYKLSGDNEYAMNAEYLSSDQMRTMIRGRIWKRTTSFSEE